MTSLIAARKGATSTTILSRGQRLDPPSSHWLTLTETTQQTTKNYATSGILAKSSTNVVKAALAESSIISWFHQSKCIKIRKKAPQAARNCFSLVRATRGPSQPTFDREAFQKPKNRIRWSSNPQKAPENLPKSGQCRHQPQKIGKIPPKTGLIYLPCAKKLSDISDLDHFRGDLIIVLAC